MGHLPADTSRDSDSMRLFDSDFLEFFTHVTPVAVLVIWVPVAVLLLVSAVQGAPAGQLAHIPLGIVLGLAIWTVSEYLLHRYLFHYEPTDPQMQKLFFLFHGVHHAQPQDKTRLVMPPAVSIPLALIFYGLFWLLLDQLLGAPQWVQPVMFGFLVGYLVYDMIHYATHHFPMRSRLAKYLKRHHMIHHYKEPDARYGVSSPIWDVVFGTMGKNK